MFNVGDIVHVKPRANHIRTAYIGWNSRMDKYLDKDYMIVRVVSEKEYFLQDIKTGEILSSAERTVGWFFSEDWLEPINAHEVLVSDDDITELLRC